MGGCSRRLANKTIPMLEPITMEKSQRNWNVCGYFVHWNFHSPLLLCWFCVNYPKLHQNKWMDTHPLVISEDNLETVQASCWVTSHCLTTGYWELKMVDPDKPCVLLIKRHPLWEWKVLPLDFVAPPLHSSNSRGVMSHQPASHSS